MNVSTGIAATGVIVVTTLAGLATVGELAVADDEVTVELVILIEGVYVEDATLSAAQEAHYLLPGIVGRHTLCIVARWLFR